MASKTLHQSRVRAVAIIAIAAAVLIALMIIPQVTTWVANTQRAQAAPAASPSPTDDSDGCASQVHYNASRDGKETTYAFGPEIASHKRSRIQDEVERRLCRDPALASVTSLYLDDETIGFNSRTASYVSKHKDWKSSVARIMKALRGADKFRPEKSPTGSWSYYMVKKDGSYVIRQGQTSSRGTAAVFTIGGTEYSFRLDCGFQPVGPSEFSNVPHIPKSSNPKHYAHPSAKPKATVAPTPTSKPSKSLAPKSTDPKKYRKPGDGGKGKDSGSNLKPPVTATPDPQETPDPVQHSGTSSSSQSSSSGASSSPSPSPSATSSAPPNESPNDGDADDSTSGGDPGGF